jgi:apolipoprotein N-acyltransferase
MSVTYPARVPARPVPSDLAARPVPSAHPAPAARPVPRLLALVLAALGGVVTDLAFPDVGVWVLAPVGVAMLFLAGGRDAPWWNALLGFVWGLTFFLRHILWAQYAVGDVPWVALSVMEALFVSAVMLVWTWVRRVPVVRDHATVQVLSFATLFVAGEAARSVAPFGGFPWGRLAFSQAESAVGRLAWLAGAPLVSFAVVVTGVLLAIAVLALLRLDLLPLGVSALTAVAVLAVGLAVPLATQAESGTLAVGAVQGNVSKPGLDAFENRREVLTNHVDGTYSLLDSVDQGDLDIVLWPENGSDYDPQVDAQAATDIDGAAQAVGAPILVGAQEFPETGGRYNVGLLWEPGVGVVDRYAKQHPAPFAEYIPIRELVRPFSSAVDLVTNDMIAGTEVGTIALDSDRLGRTVTIGDVICFEVAYDGLVRDSVAAGAEMLVIQTNNASFGPTAESTQQLAMSQLRAMETGRTTVQISTVGVSAVIAPNGTIVSRTGLFTHEQMIEDVALRTSTTPAVAVGPYVPWVTLAGALLLLGAAAGAGVQRRRARTTGDPSTRRSAPKR